MFTPSVIISGALATTERVSKSHFSVVWVAHAFPALIRVTAPSMLVFISPTPRTKIPLLSPLRSLARMLIRVPMSQRFITTVIMEVALSLLTLLVLLHVTTSESVSVQRVSSPQPSLRVILLIWIEVVVEQIYSFPLNQI